MLAYHSHECIRSRQRFLRDLQTQSQSSQTSPFSMIHILHQNKYTSASVNTQSSEHPFYQSKIVVIFQTCSFFTRFERFSFLNSKYCWKCVKNMPLFCIVSYEHTPASTRKCYIHTYIHTYMHCLDICIIILLLLLLYGVMRLLNLLFVILSLLRE